VTVIFALDFAEADERALAKVFLTEFADAQRSANNAPPTSFALEAPLELRAARVRGRPVGFLSMSESGCVCACV
jgi:Arp2/3 complex, 34 kD subunit p34-Arc